MLLILLPILDDALQSCFAVRPFLFSVYSNKTMTPYTDFQTHIFNIAFLPKSSVKTLAHPHFTVTLILLKRFCFVFSATEYRNCRIYYIIGANRIKY